MGRVNFLTNSKSGVTLKTSQQDPEVCLSFRDFLHAAGPFVCAFVFVFVFHIFPISAISCRQQQAGGSVFVLLYSTATAASLPAARLPPQEKI